jgi:hypothetical protein
MHKAYCLNEYVAGVKRLQGAFDSLIVDNSKEDTYLGEIRRLELSAVKGPWKEAVRDRIVASRNILRQKALDEGYDWFFSLEQDVIPPVDALQQLLASGKKIIGGVYTKHYELVAGEKRIGNEERPLLWTRHNGKITQMTMNELEPARVQQVLFTGLGCLLIHRSILEKIEFRCDPAKKGFDDVFFCHDAIKNKFEIYADTSVRCEHLERVWDLT